VICERERIKIPFNPESLLFIESNVLLHCQLSEIRYSSNHWMSSDHVG